MRLDKLLSSLGYCSRREVRALLREGHVTVSGSSRLSPDMHVEPSSVSVDGEALDALPPIVLMLNKPAGHECSHAASGPSVYDCLPDRFRVRNPTLACVGRLDKDTTGLLLLTDDGELLHALTSPKKHVEKAYRVTLRDTLKGTEVALFASGNLLLDGEEKPLLPAVLLVLGEREAELVICEGRFHQVKRMFEACGNEVVSLHRARVGKLELGTLPEGEWRFLEPLEVELLRQPNQA
ncbi:MAG: rRNA pseudouridine synthase [Oligoflexia bacterium]|nr:rRNA pseudouridine synthase [Oligoflexia bacterium]